MPSKILIVENDSNIIELLTYNLEQTSFDVHAVLDGAGALQRAAADVPDLIILDGSSELSVEMELAIGMLQ